MTDVVNRTTVEYITSVRAPLYPTATWIHDPDLSLLLGIVDQKYWKVVSDTVVEMTAGEKDVVDEVEEEETHHKDFSFEQNFIETVLDSNFWGTPIVSGTNSELLNPRRVKGGIITLRSGDAADRYVVLAQDNKAFMLAKSFQLDVRLETPQLADSDTEIGLCEDTVTGFMTNEVIKFTRSGTANWFARCISSATETSVDTGVAPIDTDYIHLRIKGIREKVRFLIDGTLVATIETNLPTGPLEIYLGQKTTGGTATRNLRIDKVWGSSREA